MKRLVILILLLAVYLSGCNAPAAAPEQKQYNATFLTLFDTVTTIVGRAESETEFKGIVQEIHDDLLEYHQLFDIYNEYDSIVNLKSVNELAGIAPVTVDERIVRLLLDCKDFYEVTDGLVNVAMGSVLSLWHKARTDGRDDPANAYLPDKEALTEAAKHINFNSVIIDEKASTVYFSDPEIRLDVGAIAKGWAAEQVAKSAPSGLLISVGGNVCATGPKSEDGTPWVVGIQNPDGTASYLHTLYLTSGCIVTSGDYQRAYTVDGKQYHHIIDPNTLYPSEYWRSVSVVCDDSATADALSTALFLLPFDEGQLLLTKYHAEALLVDLDGKLHYSPGFKDFIRT